MSRVIGCRPGVDGWLLLGLLGLSGWRVSVVELGEEGGVLVTASRSGVVLSERGRRVADAALPLVSRAFGWRRPGG